MSDVPSPTPAIASSVVRPKMDNSPAPPSSPWPERLRKRLAADSASRTSCPSKPAPPSPPWSARLRTRLAADSASPTSCPSQPQSSACGVTGAKCKQTGVDASDARGGLGKRANLALHNASLNPTGVCAVPSVEREHWKFELHHFYNVEYFGGSKPGEFRVLKICKFDKVFFQAIDMQCLNGREPSDDDARSYRYDRTRRVEACSWPLVVDV